MTKDIDFMAYADENTPPDIVLKMLHAAQRDKLTSLEREALLSTENAHLKVKLFGKSSERRKKPKEPDPQVFDEAKATADDLTKDEAIAVATGVLDQSTDNVTIKAPEKTKKEKIRKPIPAEYPRVEVIHDLNDDQKVCSCGCQMTSFGMDISEQLDVVPAYIRVLRHKRLKYACKSCEEGVKTAPVVTQAISKCMAAPGLLAHVAVSKYDDHLPLYRQSEIWGRMGVELSRATISSWVLKMGSALSPLIHHMQHHIVHSIYVKADETTIQVLRTPQKSDMSKSYMWVYMNANTPKPAVVYDYQETRQGERAKEFLNGFQGVLQTDGYSGYHCVTSQEGITAMGCWAHARRKFHDVYKLAKQEGVASKALEMIGKLYTIEAEIKEESNGIKLKTRQEKSTPILDAFYQWLNEIKPNVQPKGGLAKAIGYALNQKEHLMYYVKDGAVDIDNNKAERHIKPFAVGRKNWLFMGSPDGARAGATLLSLIETAKLNGLNPEGYLKHVLSHKIDGTDRKLIESLMPWNVRLPEEYPPPAQIDDEQTINYGKDLKKYNYFLEDLNGTCEGFSHFVRYQWGSVDGYV
jgi:transposase